MKKMFVVLLFALVVLSVAQARLLDTEFQFESTYALWTVPIQILMLTTLFFLESLLFYTKRVNGTIEFEEKSLMTAFLKKSGLERFCTAFWSLSLWVTGVVVATLIVFFTVTEFSRDPMAISALITIAKFVTRVVGWFAGILLGIVFTHEGYRDEYLKRYHPERVFGKKVAGVSLLVASVVTTVTQLVLWVPMWTWAASVQLFKILGFVASFVGVLLAIGFIIYKISPLVEKTEFWRMVVHFYEGSCPIVKPAETA